AEAIVLVAGGNVQHASGVGLIDLNELIEGVVPEQALLASFIGAQDRIADSVRRSGADLRDRSDGRTERHGHCVAICLGDLDESIDAIKGRGLGSVGSLKSTAIGVGGANGSAIRVIRRVFVGGTLRVGDQDGSAESAIAIYDGLIVAAA